MESFQRGKYTYILLRDTLLRLLQSKTSVTYKLKSNLVKGIIECNLQLNKQFRFVLCI